MCQRKWRRSNIPSMAQICLPNTQTRKQDLLQHENQEVPVFFSYSSALKHSPTKSLVVMTMWKLSAPQNYSYQNLPLHSQVAREGAQRALANTGHHTSPPLSLGL